MDIDTFVNAAYAEDLALVQKGIRLGLPLNESGGSLRVRHRYRDLFNGGGLLYALPLSAAAMCVQPNFRVIQALLEAGADIDGVDGHGETALTLALRVGAEHNAMRLLDLGADPWRSGSPLIEADTRRVLRRLLRMNPPQAQLDGALWKHGIRSEKITWLTGAGADVDNRIEYGYTPLHVHTNPDTIRGLVANGADLEALVEGDGFWVGWTPLGVHVQEENMADEGTRALVDLGADVNFVHSSGESILFAAVTGLEASPVKVAALLGAGADPLFAFERENALHWAVRSRWNDEDTVAIINLLAQAGTPLEARSDAEATPLFMAACHSRTAAATALLRLGVDPNRRGNDPDPDLGGAGQTPLMHSFREPELVLALLDHGADPSITDANGKTALDFARDELVYLDAPGPLDPERYIFLDKGLVEGSLRLGFPYNLEGEVEAIAVTHCQRRFKVAQSLRLLEMRNR